MVVLLHVSMFIARSKGKPLKATLGNIFEEEVKDVCLFDKLGNCCQLVPHRSHSFETVEWIQCDLCNGWLHCACMGIPLKFFKNGKPFTCCSDNPASHETV